MTKEEFDQKQQLEHTLIEKVRALTNLLYKESASPDVQTEASTKIIELIKQL